MQTQGKFAKLAVLVITGYLLLSLTTSATAQSDAVRAMYLSAANVPTNIAGIHTYPEPPKGLNPLTASDVELATYGFPQRPDKLADPEHYALWEKAMTRAKIRWHGDLRPVLGGGRGMIPAGASRTQPMGELQAQPQTGPKQLSNISGAGVILDNGVKKWNAKTSFINILATMSVPHSQAPHPNGCVASDYYSASLVGLDGEIWYGANGVPFFLPQENAGVLSEVDCAGDASYYAYLGWENSLSTAFQINPGDAVFVVVGANGGGCNSGYVYLTDLTTGVNTPYTVDPNPCSIPQIGRFANWIVWRPCCDGPGPDGAWPLADTADVFFGLGEVLNGAGAYHYPGSQAASTEILTMTDDGGDQAIETVIQGTYTGTAGLIFQTTGCGSECTP
jgi:hypothetical protein